MILEEELAVRPSPVVAAFYATDLGGGLHSPSRRQDGPWKSLRAAVPLFAGHRQPVVPSSFGYYDPGDVEVHEAQFDCARAYGISSFCYDYLESADPGQPPNVITRLVAEPNCDVRFFVKWTERPDRARPWRSRPAGERASVARHIAELAGDRRYTRLPGGRPLVVVRGHARAELPDVAEALRSECDQLGVGDPLVALIAPADPSTPLPAEIDAVVETPREARNGPTLIDVEGEERPAPFDPAEWRGAFGSYGRMKNAALTAEAPRCPWMRSAIPGFDSTPVFGMDGYVVTGDDPSSYGGWMRQILEWTYLFNSPEHWLVLAGSWNAFAQGTMVEPDLDRGDSRLSAVREALRRTDRLRRDVLAARDGALDALLATSRRYVESAGMIARELLATWQPPAQQW